MILVPLQYEDEYALIDDDDATRVSAYNWRAMNTGYIATGSIENRPNKTPRNDFMLLHRFILGLGSGRIPEVDHLNRRRNDCRKSNLEIKTRAQNMHNSFGYKEYAPKGVTLLPNGKYRAMVRHNRQLIHLGVFDTIEDAHACRLNWEKANWPELNRLSS